MSYTSNIGGKLTVMAKGNIKTYAKEDIVLNSTKKITITGKQKGVSFGKPESPSVIEKNEVQYVNGHFYNEDGTFEGKVNEKTNTGLVSDVYTCTGKGKAKDKDGKEIDVYNGIKLMKENGKNVTHSDFQLICNIVKCEGLSMDPLEYLYIAHANYNEGKDKKTTMLKRLMTGYSSVNISDKKTPLSDGTVDVISKYSRKGVIDALMREVNVSKIDPTDGARFWDGVDFLAWGINTELKADSNTKTGHNKFDEYDFVKKKKELYDKFVSNINQKFSNGVPYKSNHIVKTDLGEHIHKETKRGVRAIYDIPASDFLKKEYWTNDYFYYKNEVKKNSGIEATQVAGYSIFWKEIK